MSVVQLFPCNGGRLYTSRRKFQKFINIFKNVDIYYHVWKLCEKCIEIMPSNLRFDLNDGYFMRKTKHCLVYVM